MIKKKKNHNGADIIDLKYYPIYKKINKLSKILDHAIYFYKLINKNLYV